MKRSIPTALAGAAIALVVTAPCLARSSATSGTMHSMTAAAGVTAIENQAEAIAEGEKTGRAATAGARSVFAIWPDVRSKLSRDGAKATQLNNVTMTVNALRSDVSRHLDLRRDANEVTGALSPLFRLVGDRVPPAVHRLDYLGRSIGLDVHAGDWARASSDAGQLSATWQAIRPTVVARSGGAAARQFDHAQSAASAAVAAHNASQTVAAATQVGNAVDAVEKLF